jgi:four helix bundle protein
MSKQELQEFRSCRRTECRELVRCWRLACKGLKKEDGKRSGRLKHFIVLLLNSFNFQDTTKPAKTFKDLIVWQKAHRFVLEAYSLSASFPKSEIYCLTSQLRRAAISIPANIAEGFRKRGMSDKTRFLNVAQVSLEECRYYLILIEDLGYGTTAEMESLLEEVSKLLVAYATAIECNRRNPPSLPPSCNFSETARFPEQQFLLNSSRALARGMLLQLL